jgi:hypothetical protein
VELREWKAGLPALTPRGEDTKEYIFQRVEFASGDNDGKLDMQVSSRPAGWTAGALRGTSRAPRFMYVLCSHRLRAGVRERAEHAAHLCSGLLGVQRWRAVLAEQEEKKYMCAPPCLLVKRARAVAGVNGAWPVERRRDGADQRSGPPRSESRLSQLLVHDIARTNLHKYPIAHM